ncbi:MAG TPA: bacterial transcriptional activator domain-containing protein, partial [Solirubrobacteraceae bacterium]|nr:bacterial transcriptional activator domain-containing protein [Solirubrobacteraceae bacterium]
NAYLLTRGGSYRLNQEMVQIDADEFEAGLRGARELVGKQPEVAAERLEQALALYGGELFADCPFAEWALLERGRLHQLACDALDRLAQLRCEEGQPELARQALERLAELQPLDERVCRQLVSLDIADGRHGDAKRRHDRLARMMRESLGYPPRFTLSELAPGNADEIRK